MQITEENCMPELRRLILNFPIVQIRDFRQDKCKDALYPGVLLASTLHRTYRCPPNSFQRPSTNSFHIEEALQYLSSLLPVCQLQVLYNETQFRDLPSHFNCIQISPRLSAVKKHPH
jgi:hypothetical protein